MDIIQQLFNYFPGHQNLIHSRTFSFLQFIHFASYLFCFSGSVYKIIYDTVISCNFKSDVDKSYILETCFTGIYPVRINTVFITSFSTNDLSYSSSLWLLWSKLWAMALDIGSGPSLKEALSKNSLWGQSLAKIWPFISRKPWAGIPSMSSKWFSLNRFWCLLWLPITFSPIGIFHGISMPLDSLMSHRKYFQNKVYFSTLLWFYIIMINTVLDLEYLHSKNFLIEIH